MRHSRRILGEQDGKVSSVPSPVTSFEDVFERLDLPQGKRYVSVSKAEGKFIHQWIQEHQLQATLEVGLGYGASAASMLAAHDGVHTSIDPFQEQNFQNKGLENLETFGYQDRVVFYKDFSHKVLPKLHAERKKYDFILIDGDHRFDSIFIDFYYADLLLAQNGYILFHDSWMRSIQLVASYIRHNRSNYVQIRSVGLNLILFQKTGKKPGSTWDDFHEFYSLRGLLSHKIIRAIIRFFNP
jgi:predicted O-methyltransferase YrrM